MVTIVGVVAVGGVVGGVVVVEGGGVVGGAILIGYHNKKISSYVRYLL